MYTEHQDSDMLDCARVALNHGAQAPVAKFSHLVMVGKHMEQLAAELSDVDPWTAALMIDERVAGYTS